MVVSCLIAGSLRTRPHPILRSRQVATVIARSEEPTSAASPSGEIYLQGIALNGDFTPIFNVKTLTTLILATPKTDIEQAVGRIMRVKHNSPLIIDIIDSHDIFKRQWLKRKTFYQKNNYKLMYSSNYKQNKWEKIIKKTGKNNQKEINNNDDINMGKCLITI